MGRGRAGRGAKDRTTEAGGKEKETALVGMTGWDRAGDQDKDRGPLSFLLCRLVLGIGSL